MPPPPLRGSRQISRWASLHRVEQEHLFTDNQGRRQPRGGFPPDPTSFFDKRGVFFQNSPPPNHGYRRGEVQPPRSWPRGEERLFAPSKARKFPNASSGWPPPRASANGSTPRARLAVGLHAVQSTRVLHRRPLAPRSLRSKNSWRSQAPQHARNADAVTSPCRPAPAAPAQLFRDGGRHSAAS